MSVSNATGIQDVDLIVAELNKAKAKAIKRINRQLARMSPRDVAALERLIGRRV